MATPSYLEKTQSQLPALQLLIQMGWTYLTPEACTRLRGGRLGEAILDPILTDHIRKNVSFEFKGRSHAFTENAIQNAVQGLRNFRATGATHQNEQAYDLLCLGTSVPQTIDGDTKSFTIPYIDWLHPERNSYHCTAEYKLERIGHQAHSIPDIVLFVNGIPLVVIECKRSAYTALKKSPVQMAIDQLAGYQAKDGIPQLFLTTQFLLALARDKAEYGTNGTPEKFWTVWKESGIDNPIRDLLAKPLPADQAADLFSAPFADAAQEFKSLLHSGRAVYEQDRTLYALCRPERLLDLVYKFIVYDNGIKKIARYQQFFTVRDILARVDSTTDPAPRPGGVVWHTQGSGKSLTMVMLAKSLALDPRISSPKIILVTDRIDLDDQICNTFRACGLEPDQASTGTDLVKLLNDHKTHVVTTLINKFASATTSRDLKKPSRNTFVLVDEGHRSQSGERHARMHLALKGACMIAFTGTPLARNAKKNTFLQFGDLFQPAYTISNAVEDKAVVPLLYEARHVPQPVDQAALDSWFEKVTAPLSDAQKADLKRKFSSVRQLNTATQKIRMVAYDVSLHYAMVYQGTGLKGQLVAPSKAAALEYKACFDEHGMVSTDVLMSPPTQQEGEDPPVAVASAKEKEKVFWDGMMDRYGTEKNYNKTLINAFKRGDDPEIIIVVDKLLTGFDAPCNTALYLTRKLKDHTLLQAIARVNRLHEGKEHGLILDYSGVIEELDEAIDFYAQLANYDSSDLEQTVGYVKDIAATLPQLHSDLWEVFASVRGAKDPEAYEELLRDQERRDRFYERFGLFARTLALALSSTTFLEETPEKQILTYKSDLKFFQNLRAAAAKRFQERVDFSEYEPRIKKLIDTHVGAGEVEPLCEPINLLNAAEREQVLADQGKSADAKADAIASATRHTIEREMEKDPVFYTKFSKLIENILDDLHHKRIQAIEALKDLTDIAVKVATHTDDDALPQSLYGQDMARRYFGTVKEDLAPYHVKDPDIVAQIALEVDRRIRELKIRDWHRNHDVLNRMRNEVDDVLFEYAAKTDMELPIDIQDRIIDKCIEIARANAD
ncbi:MAG: HsdR family type I site-specific deoxyribonuclease [Opitutales bacterium]